MINICCVTYGKQDELVKNAIGNLEDREIWPTIVNGLREEVLSDVNKAILSGAEVILAGGANAYIVEKHVSIPVIRYKVTEFDYLIAINKGYTISPKVAIVTYQTEISTKLRTYIEQQGMKIENIIYEDSEELEWKIAQSDSEVIIGASYAIEIGQKYQRNTVLIYPSVESILEAIYDAKQMAIEIRKIKNQYKYANTIIGSSTNGIVLVDETETIVDCNNVAADIFGDRKKKYTGRLVGEFLKTWNIDTLVADKSNERSYISKIEAEDYMIKEIKLGENPRIFNGAILIFIKLNEVKRAQIEYDKKKKEDKKKLGFEAKNYFVDIVGESFVIKSVIEDAAIYAKSESSVLIYGETGVGKELFAQSIHNASLRSAGPFIAVNCGALSESLLEAELFGYDEGAFTGSKKGGKKGLFELADGGTIFLDEIGEVSSMMQTKLLRVLQEHEILHVGGDRIIPIDVRVIAATNRDLENMDTNSFRRDLLYRLNVLELLIPPLRDRDNDAVIIFEYFFLQKKNARLLKKPLSLKVKTLICLYKWPGNIREMQNICERFSLFLAQTVTLNESVMERSIIKAIGEQKLIISILEKNRYDGKNISEVLVSELKDLLSLNRESIAAVLGTSRTTIWRIMKEKNNVSK